MTSGANDRTAGESGLHRAPRDCPVCGEHLAVIRLGCPDCGTEISGMFESCQYCALGDADLEMLRVFLVSRGNMRELERHLGVSYPTARQRFADLLRKLGLEGGVVSEPADAVQSAPETPGRDAILRQLAAGELDVDAAERALTGG